MWIRKTPSRRKQELQNELAQEFRLRVSPLRPFLVVFATMSLCFLGRMAGLTTRDQGGWIDPVPFDQWLPAIVRALPAFLLSLLTVTALVYAYQLVYGPILSETRGEVLLCSNCFAARNVRTGPGCTCGGACEPIEDWHWVDEAAAGGDHDAINSAR